MFFFSRKKSRNPAHCLKSSRKKIKQVHITVYEYIFFCLFLNNPLSILLWKKFIFVVVVVPVCCQPLQVCSMMNEWWIFCWRKNKTETIVFFWPFHFETNFFYSFSFMFALFSESLLLLLLLWSIWIDGNEEMGKIFFSFHSSILFFPVIYNLQKSFLYDNRFYNFLPWCFRVCVCVKKWHFLSSPSFFLFA